MLNNNYTLDVVIFTSKLEPVARLPRRPHQDTSARPKRCNKVRNFTTSSDKYLSHEMSSCQLKGPQAPDEPANRDCSSGYGVRKQHANNQQIDGKQQLAHGGLIHIYHKYRSPSSQNKSKSITGEDSVVQHLLASRNSEYGSPMTRIMELINHHSPLIVVSSDSARSSVPVESSQHNPDLKEQSSEAGVSTSSRSYGNGAIERNQWVPVELGGAGLYPPSMSHMSPQQQQLIQTSVPYEQYLVDPASLGHHHGLASSSLAGITLLSPANLNFHHPTAGYQQIATIPYPSAEAAPSHYQPQQAIHQSGLEDRIQPIFLSSYVPEVPVHLVKADAYGEQKQQRPDSIQQIQFSQQQQTQPTTANSPTANKPTPKSVPATQSKELSSGSSEAGGSDDEKQAQNNEEPDDSHPNGGPNGDIEETAKARPGGEESGESRNLGSSSYEDKSDSDKDEQPGGQSTERTKNTSDEPKAGLTNGLVNVGLNDDCLQCICRASSGCDHLLRCITRGAEEKYCGPFQLTEEYWNKAGSPGDQASNFISFEDCANDADCAVETVTNYMKKYHKDCDGDENITCMDYARLHRLAPNECDNTEKLANHFDAYWAKFQRCAEGYNRSRNGDDEDI